MTRRFLLAATWLLLLCQATGKVRADALSDVQGRGICGGERTRREVDLMSSRVPTIRRRFRVSRWTWRNYWPGGWACGPNSAQGQWDKLPDLMDRGDIDLVLNGYEWSDNRAARYGVSIPYYIYELQLLGRRSDDSLRSLGRSAQPLRGRKRKVCCSGWDRRAAVHLKTSAVAGSKL